MTLRKGIVKDGIKIVLVIGFFVLLAYIIFSLTIVPKTPATAEQVWDVLVSQGYEPQDITEQLYQSKPNAKQTLTKCIAIEKDDIHFEFYVFNNKNSAIDIYGQAYTKIILEKNAFPRSEYHTQIANHNIYTLTASGSFSVAIYVETTAVYAYCDEDNSGKIIDILSEIDYEPY